MELVLQESGGLRRTAPVQSPVPVRARLSVGQRVVVLGFVVLLVAAYVLGALQGVVPRAVRVVPVPGVPAR